MRMWEQPAVRRPGCIGRLLLTVRAAYLRPDFQSRAAFDLGWLWILGGAALRALRSWGLGFAALAAGVNRRDTFLLNLLIVPEPAQPVHLRLAPEPGHLALGVIAMSLLRRHNGLLPAILPAKKLRGLLVAERSQGTSIRAIFLNQGLRLFHQPPIEHAPSALVDAFVQRLAIRIESEPQNAEAAQWVATLLLPEFRHLLP